ncbi:MAG: hypothetical protein ACRDNL_25185 [Spirillospora sp.]
MHLGAWGSRHRPTSPELRAGAEYMEAAGPELWDDLMAELRERHLGIPRPAAPGPTATERLTAAYATIVATQNPR